MPASMIHCPYAHRNLFLKTWCSPASKALRVFSGIRIMTQLLDPVYQVLSLATAYPSAYFSCFFNVPVKWSCSSPLISSVPLSHTCRNLHHNSLCLDTPSNSQILLILRSQPEGNFLQEAFPKPLWSPVYTPPQACICTQIPEWDVSVHSPFTLPKSPYHSVSLLMGMPHKSDSFTSTIPFSDC